MTPSDYVAARVRAVRQTRGLTASQLAARCADLGFPQLTKNVIGDIETGRKGSNRYRRRPVSVDELLALALALNAPPLYLLIPPDDPDTPYPVTPTETLGRRWVAEWFTGTGPVLPRMASAGETRKYYAELPDDKFAAALLTHSTGL